MGIRSGVERITPELAVKILEEAKINVQNRPVADGHVEWLARQMSAGKWTLNGEAIVLDDEDQLLDGQHRLWAIVNSGVTIESMVTRGVDRRSFATIDTGKARTTGAVLGIVGEKYSMALSAALGWIHRHEVGRMLWTSRNSGFTSQVALQLMKKHPGLRDAVEWAYTVKKHIIWSKVPISPIAFMRYMFSTYDAAKAAQFFDLVGDAAPDGPGTVTRLLRDWYFKRQRNAGHGGTAELMAVTVKAWTAFLTGKHVAILRWSQGGQTPEPFPAFPGTEQKLRVVKKVAQ